MSINETFACCFPRISEEVVEVEGNEQEIMAMTSFMKEKKKRDSVKMWAFKLYYH